MSSLFDRTGLSENNNLLYHNSAVTMEMTLLMILSFDFGQTSPQRLRRLYHEDKQVKWTEAQEFCKKNASNLVTVYDVEEIKNLERFQIISFWSGLKRASQRSRWSNGEPVRFNQSSATFTVYDQKCEGIFNDTWMTYDCTEQKPFMCSDTHGSYHLIKHRKTWCEALRYCRRHHDDLASISDPHQNREVIRKGKIAGLPFWIGLLHDDWEWDDQGCSHFRDWRSNTSSEHCAISTYFPHVSLLPYHCNTMFDIVCSKGNVIPMLITEPKLNWEDAHDYCLEHYDGMLTILTEDDQKVLEERWKNRVVSGNVWVGLGQSRIFGFWIWMSDHTVKWHNWKGGQAPEMPLSNNCGAVSMEDFKWSDQNCLVKHYFACEKVV